MTRRSQSKQLAITAIFFAIMLTIQLISNLVFSLWPIPIKPTLVHIPVIIASILYGSKLGAGLGFLMGLMSLITNTVLLLPTSYLFSPFVSGGNLYSLIIALVPRVLIGITPAFFYQKNKTKLGLFLAGAIGSLTNTIFVLAGIFFLFTQVYQGNIKALLASVVSANALIEVLISAFVVSILVPRLKSV